LQIHGAASIINAQLPSTRPSIFSRVPLLAFMRSAGLQSGCRAGVPARTANNPRSTPPLSSLYL
jgi:hypothetical protein